MSVKKILFICMGNICRSPSAEAVFTQLLKSKGEDQFYYVDSAGTLSYHAGSKPDRRSMLAAAKRGLNMSHLRARQVVSEDYEKFDWLVVMDEDNRDNLIKMFPAQQQDKVVSMMRFAKDSSYDEVPDPYYGGTAGFERVLDLIEEASDGLLEAISKKHL